jgi:hypothetical protein
LRSPRSRQIHELLQRFEVEVTLDVLKLSVKLVSSLNKFLQFIFFEFGREYLQIRVLYSMHPYIKYIIQHYDKKLTPQKTLFTCHFREEQMRMTLAAMPEALGPNMQR